MIETVLDVINTKRRFHGDEKNDHSCCDIAAVFHFHGDIRDGC